MTLPRRVTQAVRLARASSCTQRLGQTGPKGGKSPVSNFIQSPCQAAYSCWGRPLRLIRKHLPSQVAIEATSSGMVQIKLKKLLPFWPCIIACHRDAACVFNQPQHRQVTSHQHSSELNCIGLLHHTPASKTHISVIFLILSVAEDQPVHLCLHLHWSDIKSAT